MAKQAITLKIAGKSYSFTIESGKEEAYRLAEREVNDYLTRIKQENYKGWNEPDYLAMTALRVAINNVDIRQRRERTDDDLGRLGELDRQLDDYLTALEG